jgi:hypothetical protein
LSALRYVYGIVPASAASAVDSAALRGIEGGAVRALADGPFAAAVSDLDEVAWGSEVLNEQVRDVAWLAPHAEAHQTVNARLLDLAGVVLPLSFGALYRDDSRVREMLREDAGARSARLASLAGRAEWVVTGVRDAASLPNDDGGVRELDREIAASAPGRGYLLEKRRTSVVSAATERADADAARQALDRLEAVSERAYREPVAKGGEDVVVLRVSLLAQRERAASIDRVIAALGDELVPRGYHVRASGPWPAYRFGSLPA